MTSKSKTSPATRTRAARPLANIACWVIVLAGALQFIVLTGLAMKFYAGGTLFDESARGYSFWSNSFSDLGRRQSLTGQSNLLSAMLYQTAMIGLILSFIPLWICWPQAAPRLGRLARLVRTLGLLAVPGMIGVAFTPADVQTRWHMITIGAAAVPVVPAILLCLVGLIAEPTCPRWLKAWTILLAGLASAHFTQYIHHFWLGGPWTPASTTVQKLLAVAAMGWLILLSLWRLSQNTRRP